MVNILQTKRFEISIPLLGWHRVKDECVTQLIFGSRCVDAEGILSNKIIKD